MGKIQVDHTGAGGGITLSSDGTDLLLDGTAIGGGGAALELYAENPSTPTTPIATGANAVAIGSGAKAASSSAIGIGPGSWARSDTTFAVFGDAQPSSVAAVAIGVGTVASGAAALALGRDAFALVASSISLGKSRASGTDSFAAAIANNTSSYGTTGANSIAMGAFAKATGSRSITFGRYGQATNTRSISIGDSSVCTGDSAVAIGYVSSASQNYSTALGFRSSSDIVGKFAYASGIFTAAGDAQTGTFVLRSDTTDATSEALTTNKSTAGATNQVILPDNSAYFFSGTIVARQDAASGTDMGAWEIKGAIRREGSAAATTLVKSTIDDFNVPTGWVVALTADTTNGGLAITVTGAAATNIRWVATVNTSEVTY